MRFPPHYYIEKLLAYNSVNTAPVDTIKAFHLNGVKRSALPIPTQIIERHFEKIKSLSIDFNAVLDKQISDGLKSFKDAFKDILESL
ncbi:MAG: transaldolase family protein [Sulfurimonas sp.]